MKMTTKECMLTRECTGRRGTRKRGKMIRIFTSFFTHISRGFKFSLTVHERKFFGNSFKPSVKYIAPLVVMNSTARRKERMKRKVFNREKQRSCIAQNPVSKRSEKAFMQHQHCYWCQEEQKICLSSHSSLTKIKAYQKSMKKTKPSK